MGASPDMSPSLQRRALIQAGCWVMPAITAVAAAPLMAASSPPGPSLNLPPDTVVDSIGRDDLTDRELLQHVDEQLAALPPGDRNKAAVLLLPTTGGNRLYVTRVVSQTPNDQSTWSPSQAGYEIIHTGQGFDGAVPIVIKSNNASGLYTVYFRIDDGPEQSFTMYYTNH